MTLCYRNSQQSEINKLKSNIHNNNGLSFLKKIQNIFNLLNKQDEQNSQGMIKFDLNILIKLKTIIYSNNIKIYPNLIKLYYSLLNCIYCNVDTLFKEPGKAKDYILEYVIKNIKIFFIFDNAYIQELHKQETNVSKRSKTPLKKNKLLLLLDSLENILYWYKFKRDANVELNTGIIRSSHKNKLLKTTLLEELNEQLKNFKENPATKEKLNNISNFFNDPHNRVGISDWAYYNNRYIYHLYFELIESIEEILTTKEKDNNFIETLYALINKKNPLFYKILELRINMLYEINEFKKNQNIDIEKKIKTFQELINNFMFNEIKKMIDSEEFKNNLKDIISY